MEKKSDKLVPRFEFCTEESNKFWEPRLEGNLFTVRFGKIGTNGQARTRQFSTSAKAQAEYRKIVCEKLAKGYKPTAETALALLEKAVPIKKPEAVTSFCLGQYIDQGVASELCTWLTACLHHGMTAAQLKRIMDRFIDGEEVTEGFGMEWEEYLCQYASNLDSLSKFYQKAIVGKADRFVSYYDQKEEAIHVIALRGDASKKVITACIAQNDHITDEGDSTSEG